MKKKGGDNLYGFVGNDGVNRVDLFGLALPKDPFNLKIFEARCYAYLVCACADGSGEGGCGSTENSSSVSATGSSRDDAEKKGIEAAKAQAEKELSCSDNKSSSCNCHDSPCVQEGEPQPACITLHYKI